MKRIVVINNSDRALTYGIGTYTISLIECLKRTDFSFDIVYLNAEVYELKIVENNGYRDFFIPAFEGTTNKKLLPYCQMLPFIFKELFNADDDMVFHFNYFITDSLIADLKTTFHCKVIFAVHFTNWSLMLNGDSHKMKSIMYKVNNKQDISPAEKVVMDSIKVDKAIFQQTDLILFVAQHTATTYSKISVLQDTKYMVVNNGLKDEYKKLSPSQKTSIRKRYHIKETEKVIFFSGRLDEIKGIYCLIEAFQKVIRTQPDAHLLIAGEGDFTKLLSKSRYAGSKITFLGFLNKSELFDFYRIADIGISCSIHEEFGLVALEMMMHELPVIVTNTGGLAEIIEDNMDGLKVKVVYKKGQRTIDVDQLAKKISFLIDNPDECKRLGDNARKKFLSNYELSMFRSNMCQIYNSL